MATDTRTPEQIRRELETERERLTDAVDSLREGIGDATDLRSKLPLIAAASMGAGFFLAGGIGASARLLFRRGREGTTRAKFGRFSFVDRD
jgi:hypothetical protein